VMPARRTLEPLERSLGTKPKYDMSCEAVRKRRRSPTSATIVAATMTPTPRNA